MKAKFPFLLPGCVAFALTATVIPLAARAEPIAIVKPGDAAMTCPALAAEINALGQAPAPAAKPKKRGFGFLKVVGAIVPGVGMLNGVAGGLVSSAAAAGSAVAQNSARDDAMAAAGGKPDEIADKVAAQQRQARLMALFDDKHC